MIPPTNHFPYKDAMPQKGTGKNCLLAPSDEGAPYDSEIAMAAGKYPPVTGDQPEDAIAINGGADPKGKKKQREDWRAMNIGA
ncbi:MAG: hypothetical protein CM15mP46_5670 [Alphaproteobacteria bacterium]|nr:MAG: hypothetical protein CM15mP46_5670 [Alphaproteobacteria bacterium]